MIHSISSSTGRSLEGTPTIPGSQAHSEHAPPRGKPSLGSDALELSPAAQRALERKNAENTRHPETEESKDPNDSTQIEEIGANLSEEEKAQVRELQSIDRKVRAHEQAHLSAAGGIATGGISLEYQVGPDGKNYAVAGEVQIDSGPAATPEATLAKAAQIQAAATAPAEPSSADLQVAAKAAQLRMEATAELAEQAREENSGTAETYNRSGISSFDHELGRALDVFG